MYNENASPFLTRTLRSSLCWFLGHLFPECSYPFTDDTGPPLESVVEFCENAKAWLDADEENVVSLHCKAGKGRAGIMAACLMVRMGESAHAAVAKYDEVSTRYRPG